MLAVYLCILKIHSLTPRSPQKFILSQRSFFCYLLCVCLQSIYVPAQTQKRAERKKKAMEGTNVRKERISHLEPKSVTGLVTTWLATCFSGSLPRIQTMNRKHGVFLRTIPHYISEITCPSFSQNPLPPHTT